MLARTTDELKAIKNMGVKSVNEIVQKVKDYVSDPANFDVATISDVSNHTPKHERIELDPAFKSALEAMPMGDEYSTDGFSDNQMGHFEKLKDASETVGEDICFEAYLNPEYVLTICNALMEFATPYMQYRNAMKEAVQKIGNLPDSMRQLKAMLFIRAYSATAGEKLPYLLSECSDDTTVEHIPLLYEKLRKEENMTVLTSDTNKFLGWLNFDVFTLISSISANIRSILAGRNERAIEIFALRSKGETLEAVGSLYGVTRERIRQIESKVHRTFWNVYEKQKYDLIMLVYALQNGDNVLHFDELKNTVGDEFAAVLWACIKHNQEHEHYYYSKTLDANYEYDGYVFVNELGERMRPNYLTEYFPKYIAKHGMPKMRFHDLRHSCASLLLANGVPLKQIQEWLGHSDFSTTANIYAHLDYRSKISSAQAMEQGMLLPRSDDFGSRWENVTEQGKITEPDSNPVFD